MELYDMNDYFSFFDSLFPTGALLSHSVTHPYQQMNAWDVEIWTMDYCGF